MQSPRSTTPPRTAARTPRKAPAPLTPMERFGAFGLVVRFFYQVLSGFVWLYQHTLQPLTRPFWRLGRYLFRQYRRLWERVVYLRSGHFSKIRAAGMIALTAMVAVSAVPVAAFTYDAAMFAVTYDIEDIYLTNSQEIDPEHNLHSIKGCEDLPCTEANSVYYRVREDHFNSIWSMLHHGHLFYPDYVAAAVPPVVSKCHVTSYGFRFKFAMRQWNVYPDMLEAHCQPLVGQQ